MAGLAPLAARKSKSAPDPKRPAPVKLKAQHEQERSTALHPPPLSIRAARPPPLVAPLKEERIQAKLTVSEPNDELEKEADHVADKVMTRMPAAPASPGDEDEKKHVQAKLTVSEPNDPFEKEADRVADQVMRMKDPVAREPLAASGAVQGSPEDGELQRAADEEPAEEDVHPPTIRRMAAFPGIQRKCAACSTEIADDDSETKVVQRLCKQCSGEKDETRVQTKLADGGETEEPGPTFGQRLREARSAGGSPLPSGLRRFMEPRFGQDLSRVRVHTDARADSLNRSVSARAFTTGHDIFFRPGEFRPSSADGRRLIAHELTHVVQQRQEMHSVQRDVVQRQRDPLQEAESHSSLSFELEEKAPFSLVKEAAKLRERLNVSDNLLRVHAWLVENRGLIVAAEKRFLVDRRAIAGAIAWEAVVNALAQSVRAVGPGKVHFKSSQLPFKEGDPVAKQVEDLGLLAPQSLDSRKQILRTVEGSIDYIGAIMAGGAVIASEFGYDIWRDPAILCYFYQREDLKTWRARLAGRSRTTPLSPGVDPRTNMGAWVAARIAFLEDAVGAPDTPSPMAVEATPLDTGSRLESRPVQGQQRLLQRALDTTAGTVHRAADEEDPNIEEDPDRLEGVIQRTPASSPAKRAASAPRRRKLATSTRLRTRKPEQPKQDDQGQTSGGGGAPAIEDSVTAFAEDMTIQAEELRKKRLEKNTENVDLDDALGKRKKHAVHVVTFSLSGNKKSKARTPAEQALEVAAGKSKVCWSAHMVDKARHVLMKVDGKPSWNAKAAFGEDFEEFKTRWGQVMKEHELKNAAGGNGWPTWDEFHLEVPGGKVSRSDVVATQCLDEYARLTREEGKKRNTKFEKNNARLLKPYLEKHEDEQEGEATEEVNRVPAPDAATRTPPRAFSEGLRQAQTAGGSQLPGGVRGFMEGRFARDFGDVRIHIDERASSLNRGIGARAFTVGRDVFFNRSEFKPNTEDGSHLIAHELAHVVQQEDQPQTVSRQPIESDETPMAGDEMRAPDDTAAVDEMAARLESVQPPEPAPLEPAPPQPAAPGAQPAGTTAPPEIGAPAAAAEVRAVKEQPAPTLEGVQTADPELDALASPEQAPAEETNEAPPDLVELAEPEPTSLLTDMGPAPREPAPDAEIANPEQIDALVSQLDDAEATAQTTVEAQASTSRGALTSAAASTRKNVDAQAESAKATIEASFAAEEAALDAAVLGASAGIDAEIVTAEAQVNRNVDDAVAEITTRFQQAHERVNARIDRGKNVEIPAIKTKLKNEAINQLAAQVQAVNRIGDEEIDRYPIETERGQEQRKAVHAVRQKLIDDLSMEQPKITVDIDESFMDLPDKFEKNREQVHEKLDEPRDAFLEAFEGERQPTLDALHERADAAKERLENAARDLREGLGTARDTALAAIEKIRLSTSAGVSMGRDASLGAVGKVGASTMNQLGGTLSEGRTALSTALAPPLDAAVEVTDELTAGAQQGASHGAASLEQATSSSVPKFTDLQAQAAQALASIVSGSATTLAQFTAGRETVAGLPKALHTEFEAVQIDQVQLFTDLGTQVDTALGQTEGQLDESITTALQTAENEAGAKLQERLQESSQEIVLKSRQAMREAGTRAGFDFDHPILGAVFNAIDFAAGIVVGILGVALIVGILVGLVALGGVWAILASVLIIVGLIGLIVGAIRAYRERRALGQGAVPAFFGSLLDALGVSVAAEGIEEFRKTGASYSSGKKIGEGFANAFLLVLGPVEAAGEFVAGGGARAAIAALGSSAGRRALGRAIAEGVANKGKALAEGFEAGKKAVVEAAEGVGRALKKLVVEPEPKPRFEPPGERPATPEVKPTEGEAEPKPKVEEPEPVGPKPVRQATASELQSFANHDFTYDPETGVATKTVGGKIHTIEVNSDGELVYSINGEPIATEHQVLGSHDQAPGTLGFFNSHHPIQHAWAKERLGKLPASVLKDPAGIYDRDAVPTLLLREGFGGSPHRQITTSQGQRAGSIPQRNYPTERALADAEMTRSGVPEPVRRDVLGRDDAYFKKLHDNITDPVRRRDIFGDYFE